jgi:uncharacterized membrane-anchored protein
LTILVANTLGTALGDFAADSLGLGFEGGAALFAGLLLIVVLVWRFARGVPIAVLFWAAYVLTRPLGATLGDTVTKPLAQGGLAMDRISASLAILAAMAVILVVARLASGKARLAASSAD